MSGWGTAARIAGRVAVAALGVAAARATLKGIRESPAAGLLDRANHRGHTVSLAAGPAFTAAATGAAVVGAIATGAASGAGGVAAGAAAAVTGLTSGAVGLYDDMVGQQPDQKAAKGLKGHLGALREGRVTSGMVKIIGIGTAGLLAARLLARKDPQRGALDTIIDAGVIAGAANLFNLLDLRPGRALKAGVIAAAPMSALAGPAGGIAAGVAGAAAGILPEDLDEQVMLGDSGANALGALLGTALAARTSRPVRAVVLAGIAGLTLASEQVSFTKVIESTPGLREIDAAGRRKHPEQ